VLAARQLRRNESSAEVVLWDAIRGRRLNGLKVLRQFPVGGYMLDFAIRDCRLGIELDGSSHDDRQEEDALRTASLAERGYRIIRFRNDDVLDNLDGVLERIVAATRASLSPGERERGSGGEGS
jgi:very-short-patch-repair endonuclease